MAVLEGVNSGECAVAPTADPAGAASLTIDSKAWGQKVTLSGTGPKRIIEMGWWCKTASQEAMWIGGWYTDAGASEPELRQVSTGDRAKGIDAGWKRATGLSWEGMNGGDTIWINVQLDDTTTTTTIDIAASGGSGYAFKNSVGTLPADWGTSSGTDTDASVAIYFRVEDAGGTVHDVSVTEGATATDTPAAVATFAPSISEAASATDAPSAVATFPVAIAEAGSATDAPSAAAVFAPTLTEAAGAVDATSATAVFSAAVAEGATATDAPGAVATYGASLTETATATDTQTAVDAAIAGAVFGQLTLAPLPAGAVTHAPTVLGTLSLAALPAGRVTVEPL